MDSPPDTIASEQTVTATFSHRLFAFLVDGFLLSFALGALAAFLNPAAGSTAEIVLGLFVYVGFLVYHGVLNALPGWTPGKWLAGIRVVDFEGKSPSPGRSFFRAFGYFLSGIPLGLGFLWALRGKTGKTWHDMLAGTRVISVRQSGKATNWAIAAAAWLLLLGGLAGAFYRGLGQPAVADLEDVQAARQTLQALAALEDRHHARTGSYTDSLLTLSADAQDPSGLLQALPKAIAADTLILQMSPASYRISAKALDSQATLVQLQGPAAAAP